MADEFEQQEWFKFGMAATLSKQYAADQRMFLELLAQMLEGALPGEAEIGRKGGLFSKKTVQRISLQIGSDRYTLEDPGRGPLRATRTRIVRNIALKTEEIPVQDWLAELGAALDERARTSQAAREALARLIG
ncbi:MAG TPA: hypothetical protein VKU00_18135 [Chthonomonadaceae bacterium]|nr:hypothetical protein [Chthonomonadaceae bacterium]